MTFTVGVLTVSDTASNDAQLDRSGPLLSTLLEERSNGALRVVKRAIVPDDVDAIRQTVQEWLEGTKESKEVNMVISTGGTGFGKRDVTPEAVASLIDKPSTGLTHALMQYSLSKTPLAALSRLTTGVRQSGARKDRHGLIITLPGSSNAVKECCEVLLGDGGVLLHALDLLSGGSGAGTHKEMQQAGQTRDGHSTSLTGTETDTGKSRLAHTHHEHHHQNDDHHQHHHSHRNIGHGHSHQAPKPRTAAFKTHDPTQSVTLRHRLSPYPIISMDDALRLILDITPVNEPISVPVSAEIRGYLLAQDIIAPRSLPPKPTTNVDGYAVNAAKTPPGPYRVVTRGGRLSDGSVYRINTGQGLPDGADAVLMVEDSDLLEEDADGEEKTIQVKAQIDAGENVRAAGSDVRQGQVVLTEGVKLSDIGGEIGTLAFLGQREVRVIRKPRVAILSTGNELYDVASVPLSTQQHGAQDNWEFRVTDANRPSITAALRGAGFDVLDLGIVGDSVDQTLAALQRGLEEADVVISTGGTSMGESDLLKPLIERRLTNGTIHFGRVAMKPGKPTTFATASSSKGKRRVIFALPGNPASAMVCLNVFVVPSLRKLSGYAASQCQLTRIKVRLQDEMRCDPRPEFHRAVIRSHAGELHAYSTGAQRSSGMHSMATANGLVCVPAMTQNSAKVLQRGTLADAIVLGQIV